MNFCKFVPLKLIPITQARHILAGIILFSVLCKGYSQPEALPCGTYKATGHFIKDAQQYRQNRAQLEAFTATFKDSSVSRETEIKIIPVVVHIMHNYGTENISDEQVYDALRILNEDFRRLNPDINEVIPAFAGITADVGFEFRLARKDPQGKCTNGITRTQTVLTFNADDNVKELISWPTNRYLNIWVVQNISFNAGGYSYLPGVSIASGVDGVIIINRQFGGIGTSSGANFAKRTLTHEVGHWFNLSHVWGDEDIGQTASCSGQGDFVGDTPKTIGTTNNGCNLAQNTCTNEIPDKVDNVQNYMDYSGCALMFTLGQKNRMIAAANSYISGRRNIWSDSNLVFTGVNNSPGVCTPIADFKASATQVCPGTSLTLSDKSYNATIDNTWTWSWSLPGANPATSDAQNPTIKYNSPGVYPITLTVSNSKGSGTLTRTEFVYVYTDNPSIKAPLTEGFESGSFPASTSNFNTNWRVDGAESSFVRTNASSSSGNYSLKYQNLDHPAGTVSSVISPSINFSDAKSPATITFRLAYARKNAESTDRLEVFISTDCGKTWQRRYQKSGANLATTNSLLKNAFTPNADQWRTETVQVGNLAGVSKGLIRFTFTDGDGNNLYIDDINIFGHVLGQEDFTLKDRLQIVPNPGAEEAVLGWDGIMLSGAEIFITDISGRLIGSRVITANASTSGGIQLAGICSNKPLPGVYIVTIQPLGSSQKTLRWIVP